MTTSDSSPVARSDLATAGLFTVVSGLLGAPLAGCTSETAPKRDVPSSTAPRPDLVKLVGDGDPRAFVVAARSEAAASGRTLVVYVGAPWCEPCTRFHDALVAGRLDGDLPGIRFLEIDHDAQAEALSTLDCSSRLIPLFSVPDDDGRCSDRRIQGGIKGEGAVADLAPRIRALVPTR